MLVSEKMQTHKVSETRTRSFLKGLTGRILEIAIGTFVFGTIFLLLGLPNPFEIGLVLNLLEETICFLISFLNERIWNKIDLGREVIDLDHNGSLQEEDGSRS